MSRIEVSCLRCGAKYVGRDIAEAMTWSDEHDKHCIVEVTK